MTKRYYKFIWLLPACALAFYFFQSYGEESRLKEKIVRELSGQTAHVWKENPPGSFNRLSGSGRKAALTFDACGSVNDGLDADIIELLKRENVPATLFFSGRWIDKNPVIAAQLAREPLFEIENHGFKHLPCSVDGRSIYGIKGTGSVREIVDEIELNARKIRALTGRKPLFYRSGTAYYDDVGILISGMLGYKVAGFSVLGDRGASYSAQQVKAALLGIKDGDIVIMHMNHPEKETAEGLKQALPELKKQGWKFVQLKDCQLE